MGRLILALAAWFVAATLPTPAQSIMWTHTNKGLVNGAMGYGPRYDPTMCHLYFLCLVLSDVDYTETLTFSEPVSAVSFRVSGYYNVMFTASVQGDSETVIKTGDELPLSFVKDITLSGGEPITSVHWRLDFLGWVGSEFRYYSISNFSVTPLQVSPVPVPAALPMLLSGLALLGLVGWRRKRQAGKAFAS